MVDVAQVLTAIASGVVDGILYGSVLGAVAVGLTLIWGVMKVVNLAHGHLVVLGGMLAAYIFIKAGIDLLVLFVAFIGLGALVGVILYYASIHKIIGKIDVITLKEEMATLMTTFGFGVVLFGLHYIAGAKIPDYKTEPSINYVLSIAGITSIDLGIVTVPVKRLVIAFIAFALALLAYMLIQRTTLGLTIQAVAQDSRALALVGINPVMTKLLTTVISSALAVASGVLYLAYIGSISPTTEFMLAPLSFVIVVLGGLGSIMGTYLGGVILGIIYMVVLYLTNVFMGQQEQTIALAVAFSLLVIMLVVRPQGLFGKK